MRRASVFLVVALFITSCTAGNSPSPSAAGNGSGAPAGSGGTGWDPSAINATVVLSGWQSSPAEGNALTQTLLSFQAAYPNIKVDYQPIAGDYPTAMAAKFASHDVPDVFYVNADYAKEWISQGFLEPLDDHVAKAGFDTSQFFEGYASVFKGDDGKTYGFPKDGNTSGLAYNSDLVPTAPTSIPMTGIPHAHISVSVWHQVSGQIENTTPKWGAIAATLLVKSSRL